LSNNNDLQNLSPKDKSDLLLFISTLNGVGKEKFAMSLQLFGDQSELKNIRPLRKLISNKVLDLPEWLNHMRIDSNEEKYLDTSFQKHLLLESDLLGQIFNDELLFKIATSKISEGNIAEFYVYIQKLIKSKDESLIGLSEIPWLYIETKKSFIKADQAYFPDSLLKLNNSKFNNTKSVINDITTLNIPHFNSFEIIKSLSLGSSRINFTDTIEKNGIFDLGLINDFLDWVVENKEDNFLSYMFITNEVDGYKIVPAEGKKSFYTSSNKLIEFINGHESLKDIFCLFDNNLYSSSRKKIGLLEDGDLIENIINDGGGNLHLVQHITTSVSKDVIVKYLLNLGKFDIDTTQSYDSTTDIYKVINLVLDNILEDEEITNKFKSKLQIDSVPLLERAISDDIFFYKTKTELKTKLSDILPEYKDKTYSLAAVVDSFVGIDKQKLRKLFEPQKISPNKIFNELHEKIKDGFNSYQTFFLSFCQVQLGIQDVFQNKKILINRIDFNNEGYGKLKQEFLSVCLNENNYVGFIGQLNFSDFKPNETILDDEFALESEIAPNWVKQWIDNEDKDARLGYLKLLGVNGSDSPVVLLRRAILDGKSDMDAARGNLTSKILFKNTLEWITDNIHKCKSILNDDFLKPLYIKANNLNLSITEIYIPVVSDIVELKYTLEKYIVGKEYHYYNVGWKGYETEIFNYLINNNNKVITDILPQKYRTDIKTIIYVAKEVLNQGLIALKIVEFSKKFYLSWYKKDQFPIKVYKGARIPYQITYNSYPIKEIEKDYVAKNGNYLLVCENIVDAIPGSIKDHMSSTLYADLNSHIKEFEESLSKINYTDEELAALKKIYNDDIPEEFRKNLNLASLVSALVQLPNEGYNIDATDINLGNTHEFAQLSPVYKENDRSIEYTVMCRSARQGLLYMTAKAWNRLGDDSIFLFADLGHGSSKLFHNKQAVLDANEKDTDYQLMRIETEAKVTNIEEILNGSFLQKDKIWIIFKIKENKTYDALFYNKLEPNNTNKNPNSIKTDFSDNVDY
jgi:hypothetical protein